MSYRVRICYDLHLESTFPPTAQKLEDCKVFVFISLANEIREQEINESWFFLQYSLKREKEEIKTEPL